MNNLRFTITDAKIGIKTTKGQYDITSSKGDQSITTTKPKMTISGEPKKAIIDSYESWAERGFKNNIDILSENAQLAKQAAINGLARVVADGNRMADIRKNMPPAIPEIAEKNTRPEIREFGFGMIPLSKPNVTIVGGQSIDWQLGSTNIDYTPSKPEINYDRGKVEVYMTQYQNLQIEYIDTRG